MVNHFVFLVGGNKTNIAFEFLAEKRDLSCLTAAKIRDSYRFLDDLACQTQNVDWRKHKYGEIAGCERKNLYMAI
jgi:hypothetical protein